MTDLEPIAHFGLTCTVDAAPDGARESGRRPWGVPGVVQGRVPREVYQDGYMEAWP